MLEWLFPEEKLFHTLFTGVPYVHRVSTTLSSQGYTPKRERQAPACLNSLPQIVTNVTDGSRAASAHRQGSRMVRHPHAATAFTTTGSPHAAALRYHRAMGTAVTVGATQPPSGYHRPCERPVLRRVPLEVCREPAAATTAASAASDDNTVGVSSTGKHLYLSTAADITQQCTAPMPRDEFNPDDSKDEPHGNRHGHQKRSVLEYACGGILSAVPDANIPTRWRW